jgi:hypothetical protein
MKVIKNIFVFLYSIAYLIGMGVFFFIPALVVICIMFPIVPLVIYTYWVATGFITI